MMAYTMCCQIIFWIYAAGIAPNPDDPCSFHATTNIPNTVLGMYGALFGVFFIADLSLPRSQVSGERSFRAFADQLRKTLRFAPILLIIWIAYLPLLFIAYDWDLVWSQSKYLSGYIAEPNLAYALISSISLPLYFSTCAFLAVTYSFGKRDFTLWLFVFATAVFVLTVSAGSRGAGVGLLLFSITRIILIRRIDWIAIVVMLLGSYTIQATLIARGEGAFGISNFFQIMALPLANRFHVVDLLANLFQGALATGDGLLARGSFSEAYKWLSFSPLPSIVDGFASIRESSQIRLHAFCPMSAVSETVRFGPVFWLMLAVQYLAMVRIINSRTVEKCYGAVPVLCLNLIFTLFSVIGFTYPLRNVLRPMTYIAILAIVGIPFFMRGRKQSSLRSRAAVRRRSRSIR